MTERRAVTIAGALLTGGSSARMGGAKALLVLDGETLAVRAARALRAVCDPVIEVGPGYTDLDTTLEDPPGRGPLAALVAAADALGTDGSVLALACDLPFVDAAALRIVAGAPGAACVVPVDGEGRPQLVCARYSAVAIARARVQLDAGERSLRALLRDVEVMYVDRGFDPRALVDVDTPEEAARWGIEVPDGLEP